MMHHHEPEYRAVSLEWLFLQSKAQWQILNKKDFVSIPGNVMWTTRPVKTKLYTVMYYHHNYVLECHAECNLQGQGHSKGSSLLKRSGLLIVIFFFFLTFEHFATKLICRCLTLSWSSMQIDLIAAFRIQVARKVLPLKKIFLLHILCTIDFFATTLCDRTLS